ncbi:hypothetical protein [Methylomonas methanica]|uniref:Uncharacterized protein n=1 Tax=Methylomonas methanica (strain DSM 25384 / MC09) TaxID=857087 RepID=F9ZV46_METMM|nr:hypothetical protein [Methylomonas methanica]AEF99479.1 hypothetical protein Metme_1043 [Methylomonas methanica MC09]
MRISTKNLKDTCSFLVNECRREVKANPVMRPLTCATYRNQFRALSLLLVGFPEKQIVMDAIDDISNVEHSKPKQEAA